MSKVTKVNGLLCSNIRKFFIIHNFSSLQTLSTFNFFMTRKKLTKKKFLQSNTIKHTNFMSKEKILVVDDEQDLVKLVRFNLEKDGYKVVTAYNGEDALFLARKERPELVILDLMLPGIDGLEVCKKLKADPELANIAIVMLTAKGEEVDITLGLKLGADDYVTKPFSPKELVARVQAVLRRSKVLRQQKIILK